MVTVNQLFRLKATHESALLTSVGRLTYSGRVIDVRPEGGAGYWIVTMLTYNDRRFTICVKTESY